MLSKDDARVGNKIDGEGEGSKYGNWAVFDFLLIGLEQLTHAYDHVQWHHYYGHSSSLHSRECEGKGSSLANHAVNLDMAAVLLDDLVSHGKAKPCAGVFGSEKRVKYLIFGGLVHANTGVDELKYHPSCQFFSGNGEIASLGHCFEGVYQDIG
jgi:hypothetical protein